MGSSSGAPERAGPGPVEGRAVTPDRVKEIMSKHLLTTGMMPLVLDMQRSRGVDLYDQATGKRYLDFFGFVASSVLGMNHPALTDDEDFNRRLREAATNKVTNSDVATVHAARFVDTFDRVGIPPYLPYAFFISGGALAVENALKAAFDWKVRKNFAKGYGRELGSQVLHFEQAFHGRTGYTLSLTNTEDPRKTRYFPRFDWPRVSSPRIIHPLDEHLERVVEAEERAIAEAKQHFLERRDDIAAVIIEPIQGEGGDHHFRPEFLRQLRALARENDALLVFDEVQTGVGITGRFWAHQAMDVEPDLIAFGKKTQVCGVLVGRRMDEVDGHVFETPGRLNSTWGGSLVDMVRFGRILEVMEETDLVSGVEALGARLLERLRELETEFAAVESARGRGLMCAFDLPDGASRDAVIRACFDNGVAILGSGSRSIRFRPPLIITPEEIDRGVDLIADAIAKAAPGA
ncbi:MAG: L-lysine 6-transaminase [Rhodothermales bacterium]